MHRLTLLLPALLLLALSGCAGVGALHQAALFKECRAGQDSCKSLAPPAPLAVGARLRPAVQVELAGSVTPTVRVLSARPDVIAADGDELRGVRPGVAPVLIESDDGAVIDFVHVWVAAPTRLAVEQAAARDAAPEEVAAPIQLVAGESRWLTPAVFGGAQRLAGAGDVAWRIECDGAPCATVALLTDGTPERRRLIARAPGKAKVVLDGLGLAASIDVEVVP